jgi:UrcA family protein
MTIIKQATLSLLAVSCTFLAVGAATGGESFAQNGDPLSINVPYLDLNMNSNEGRVELDRRINSAARQVCRSSINRLEFAGSRHFGECVAAARRVAAAQVAHIR